MNNASYLITEPVKLTQGGSLPDIKKNENIINNIDVLYNVYIDVPYRRPLRESFKIYNSSYSFNINI